MRQISTKLLRSVHCKSAQPQRLRGFSSTSIAFVQNRIYTSIRTPTELDTLLLSSASTDTPLLTLWTASWCPSCKAVLPLVKEMVESGVGANVRPAQGIGFVEVEYDAPENPELSMRYLITSIPTLLAFSRQEAQLATKVSRVEDLKSRKFLEEWIRREAERGGQGGAGGSGSGLLGGWFGGGR